MPRVAKSTSLLIRINTCYIRVVIVQVIAMSPEVLLKIETTSPAAKTEARNQLMPLAPTSINLPTSPVTKMYACSFS
jgi:hypothetical protein